MQYINLTPHRVTVIEDYVTRGARPAKHIEPSGQIARVAQESKDSGRRIDGIRIFHTVWGSIEELPDPQGGKIFIVSGLVLSALREAGDNRGDVVAPSGLVRNTEGQVIGCEGFRLQ